MSFARQKAPCAERAQPQRAAPAECSMSAWRTGKCERLHASRPGHAAHGRISPPPDPQNKTAGLAPADSLDRCATGAASISSGKPCPGAMRRPCCGCRRGRRYSSAPAFPCAVLLRGFCVSVFFCVSDAGSLSVQSCPCRLMLDGSALSSSAPAAIPFSPGLEKRPCTRLPAAFQEGSTPPEPAFPPDGSPGSSLAPLHSLLGDRRSVPTPN